MSNASPPNGLTFRFVKRPKAKSLLVAERPGWLIFAVDERQYEHVKESVLDQGKSEETAKEVAARSVNKQRREVGRTPNKTTQGTGNPRTSLEDRTVAELRNIASELGIEGRSNMKKAELAGRGFFGVGSN